MGVIRKSFLPDDLNVELNKHWIEGVVTVQARQSLEETSWLLELADKYDFIKGVVGWVDLCSNDAEKQLSRFASNKKFVGVRHVVQDEPDDQFMLRKDFQAGIRLLEKFNLTYDILIFSRHLPMAIDLVSDFPNQKFVLDHIAKPFIKDKKIDPWQSDIKELASYKNVWCKASGMVTEADWNNWTDENFNSYLKVIEESFGYDRIMLGSDWPVCLLAGNYDDVMKIPMNYFKGLPEGTIRKICRENCIQFYGLESSFG
jgi:L-fuconolactonase